MSGVPVGRRNLFSERRRAFLGIAGVGVSLLMVLALGGIFAGAMRQVTRYIDSSRTDLFVSQRGVRTMHMSSSSIPLAAVEQIRRLPGVRWADPILYDSGALIASDERELTYLIGYVPGARGGPASLVAGEEPGPGEIVLDEEVTFAAFLIGLAVIGLTLYAATLSRLREIGVTKALGATPGRLGRIVLSQAAWTVGAALEVAVLLALGVGWVLGRAEATIPLVVEAPSVARAAVGAVLLGGLGAVAPLIKVSRVDPATVFRR